MATATEGQLELSESNGKPLIEIRPPSESQALTPMGLLTVALQNNAAIDVIERLAALQEKALARDAEIQFNDAMNAAQAEIGRIAPNADNRETQTRWATYSKMDKEIRPVYIKHGFSLSFTCEECPKPEHERIACFVSHRAGHTRKYWKDIPADGKGARGGGVMSKVHASGSASSYGMRYLLKMIFNVAIGEDDNDGNVNSGPVMENLEEHLHYIADARNEADMQKAYKIAFGLAEEAQDPNAGRQIDLGKALWLIAHAEMKDLYKVYSGWFTFFQANRTENKPFQEALVKARDARLKEVRK